MWFDAAVWRLPTSLRAKIALVTLLGIFLIPITTSSLRGLTHVLTCEDEVAATLSIDNSAPEDASVLLSADSTERGEVQGLCGGLLVDLQLTTVQPEQAEVRVSIANQTDTDWQGTIQLRFGDAPVPVAIGSIPRGATATDHVELRVVPGKSYEITGTLLIGP